MGALTRACVVGAEARVGSCLVVDSLILLLNTVEVYARPTQYA